ncbi:hypothetical protein MMC34_005098 [Xylographa carneopallida]|nr:hypothetical protein [Xylographa carneopallida]
MSQSSRQQSFEAADLQLYPGLADLDQMLLSDDMGLWSGYTEPNVPSLDVHLTLDHENHSSSVKANGFGLPPTYVHGNNGRSVSGYQPNPGHNLWTSNVLLNNRPSSDAFAFTHSFDGDFPSILDSIDKLYERTIG